MHIFTGTVGFIVADVGGVTEEADVVITGGVGLLVG